MSKNFIDIEQGVSEIQVRQGIEKIVNEIEIQAKLANSWNDDVGNKVQQVLKDFLNEFSEYQSKLESELKEALNSKEEYLEEMSLEAKKALNEFVDSMKNFDVDPSLYS